MYEMTQAVKLHLKEAGMDSRPMKGQHIHQFMACWNRNWFGVYVDVRGFAWVEPMAYCATLKKHVAVWKGKEVWSKWFDLTHPRSLADITHYIKCRRNVRGRLI